MTKVFFLFGVLFGAGSFFTSNIFDALQMLSLGMLNFGLAILGRSK
jgi:hypothetical protein